MYIIPIHIPGVTEPPSDLPPCAFGLSRVQVYAKPKEHPSIDIYTGLFVGGFGESVALRWGCPYELAVAKYGDERVRFVGTFSIPVNKPCPPLEGYPELCKSTGTITYSSAKVEVCDSDGKSNCVVVYTEGAR